MKKISYQQANQIDSFVHLKNNLFFLVLLFVCLCTLSLQAQKTWTGATSTDWHTDTNWSPVGVPTEDDDVIIPDAINDPVITESLDASTSNLTIYNNGHLTNNSGSALNVYGDLLIEAGGTLSGNGYYIMLGNWNSQGVFNAETSIVEFDGNGDTEIVNGTNPLTFNEVYILANESAPSTLLIKSDLGINEGLYISDGVSIQIEPGVTVQANEDITVDGPSVSTFINYGTLNLVSVLVGSDASFQNHHVINLTGGQTITSAGTLHNHTGAVINIDDCNTIGGLISLQEGMFVNDGSILFGQTVSNVSSNAIRLNSSTPSSFVNNGLIKIDNNTGNAILKEDLAGFINNGTISIGQDGGNIGGFGMSINGTGFTNTGTVTIGNTTGNAITTAPGEIDNSSGTFKVDGNVSGWEDPTGMLAPGNSPGLINSLSDLNLSSAILEIEVDGTTPITLHDQVTVSGTATLGGILDVSINYSPTVNDRIVFLTATSVSGSFTLSTPLPTDWTLDYSVPGEVALQFGVALPVELTDFTARKQNENVVLKWETASETNNKGFEIEHSLDGRNWEAIGFMNGHGNSIEKHEYEYLHKSPINGMNYYRLRQVDFDRKYAYSNIQSVIFDHLYNYINVFPNPTSSLANIQFSGMVEEASIKVFTTDGRVLFEQKQVIGESTVTVDVEGWEAGSYLIHLTANGQEQMQYLIVTKD